MDDLKQRILDIIHKPQLAALATVTEQNNPWVRYVVTVGDGDFNLRCATFASSRKVQQIAHHFDRSVTCLPDHREGFIILVGGGGFF